MHFLKVKFAFEIFRKKKERFRQEEAIEQVLEIRKEKEALAWDGS